MVASIGSMRERLDLIRPVLTRDPAGFTQARDEVVATVRGYMEVRHASAAWVNRAAYTKADVLFRIRVIPGVSVTADMEIVSGRGRFVIDAVEHIGRYIEILAHQVTPEGRVEERSV